MCCFQDGSNWEKRIPQMEFVLLTSFMESGHLTYLDFHWRGGSYTIVRFFCIVLSIEPGTSYMLCACSITKLYPPTVADSQGQGSSGW